MTDYLPKDATIEQACAWLEARTGETWILPRLMEFHLTPYFWNDYKPGYPAIYGDRKEGYQTHMIFQGDRTRLESDGGFALVTMYAAFDGSWVTPEPGWPLPLSDLRFKREEVEEVAEIINAKKSASESEKSKVPQSFQPQQGNTQPVSALMSGGAGWGRAVNALETDAFSASPSRARAPFANHEVYDVLPTKVFETISASKQDDQRTQQAEFFTEKAELTPERVRYWLAMDCWTLDQAHCLLIGLDWNVIQLLAKNAGWDSPISVPDFSDNFRQLLCGARDKKVLIFPAAPDDVIRWAACKKLNLPELLLDYASTLDKAAPVIAAPVVAVGASGGTATLWTTERKEAARAMMNKQRGQGVKAFAANTAAAFGVTSTRLREVLNDKPKKAPAKKPKGIWGV